MNTFCFQSDCAETSRERIGLSLGHELVGPLWNCWRYISWCFSVQFGLVLLVETERFKAFLLQVCLVRLSSVERQFVQWRISMLCASSAKRTHPAKNPSWNTSLSRGSLQSPCISCWVRTRNEEGHYAELCDHCIPFGSVPFSTKANDCFLFRTFNSAWSSIEACSRVSAIWGFPLHGSCLFERNSVLGESEARVCSCQTPPRCGIRQKGEWLAEEDAGKTQLSGIFRPCGLKQNRNILLISG